MGHYDSAYEKDAEEEYQKSKVIKQQVLELLIATKNKLNRMCPTGQNYTYYYTNQLDELVLRMKGELYS